MRTIPTVIGILLLVALTSAAWIMRYRPQWLQTTAEEAANDEDVDPQKLEIPVHTGTVVRTTMHRYVEAFGVVEPAPPRPGRLAGTADVAAAAPGVVAEVLCEAGQKVAKGTPLVQLDNRLARAAQQQATAALAEAKASLAQLKATPRAEQLEISELAVEKARTAVEFAEKGYTRQQGLAKQQGTSEKNVEQASLELASAKNDLATAQKQLAMLKASPTPEELAQQVAKVAQAEAALAAAQAQEDMLKIVAPIDGTVIAVSARAGEAVDPTKVLVDIVALDRLVINVPVPEAEARMLTVGMSVDVTLVAGAPTTQPTSAPANTAPQGRIYFIGSEVDRKTDSIPLGVDIDPGVKAKPGQSARLRIVAEERKDRLAVPKESVAADDNGDMFIALVDGDQATHKIVRTGLREGALVEVDADGLNDGDSIVTSGAYGLAKLQVARIKVTDGN